MQSMSQQRSSAPPIDLVIREFTYGLIAVRGNDQCVLFF